MKWKIVSFIKTISITVNILTFYSNLLYLLSIEQFNSKFKNIDKSSLIFYSKSFSDVSNYFNNKYIVSKFKNISNLDKSKQLRKIKIGFEANINLSLFISIIKHFLKGKLDFEIDNNNPDFLIFNNMREQKYLKKKFDNTIKIAFLTENQIPDLNQVDYSISFSHLHYLDRTFYYPISFFNSARLKNLDFKNIKYIRDKIIFMKIRNKFCAAVISNARSSDLFRLKFINELNKYKKIDNGGKYKNNIKRTVKNKIQFLSLYKFSIAMENSNGDGYVSEKLLESFFAGTIPIYYGNYMIDEFINPKSYILIKGDKDIKNKIKYIKKLDNDDKLYKSILMETVLLNENIMQEYKNEMSEFLIHIFEQDKTKSKRIFN